VVNPSVPARTVAELVALLKSQPDKLTFSSGGFGTPAHLIGEQFKLQTGTRAQHVPYAQFPQAIGDLLNGTNAFMFITMLPVVDLIKTGKLRALAVTGPKRVPILPDVPTIVEAGYPSLVVARSPSG
jgi:tripartite-type tricarboxylate transporter receptor subunit TctC